MYWPSQPRSENLNSADALEHRPPQELVQSIVIKERKVLRLMEEIQTEVEVLGREEGMGEKALGDMCKFDKALRDIENRARNLSTRSNCELPAHSRSITSLTGQQYAFRFLIDWSRECGSDRVHYQNGKFALANLL